MTKRQPEWIWRSKNRQEVNQYVDFICTIEHDELNTADDIELRISVDSNFAAWFNGKFVGARSFSDIPDKKTFSTIDLSNLSVQGKNTLAIQAYYCGQDHASYIATRPGLWFTLQNAGRVVTASHAGMMCRLNPAYKYGEFDRISQQRGYNFSYDARRGDNWKQVGYVPGQEWEHAEGVNRSDVPVQRPLPMVEVSPRCEHEIIAQGVVKRIDTDESHTVAALMQRDYLSARTPKEIFENYEETRSPRPIRCVRFASTTEKQQDGVYVVLDLHREECGLIDIEIEAAAGTRVDIAVGEHLADLRVRSAVGGRNFASRYITRDGLQSFTHYTESYAGRYLQLHLTQMRGPTTLVYAGLRPTTYPVENRGAFECSKSLLNRMYEVSRHTLHLCMHERYEDCPWREQALYAGDARNQSLFGYYLFGEYDMARVSLELMAESVRDDGYMSLCAPARLAFTIPSFTMGWMLSLAEYIRFSGETHRTESMLDLADTLISRFRQGLIGGLLPCPQGMSYWHFYDWEDGLAGKVANTECDALQGIRFDAILNLYLILALRELSTVSNDCGQYAKANEYRRMAEEMRFSAHEVFWDCQKQAYRSYSGDGLEVGHYSELVQSLALRAEVCDVSQSECLLKSLVRPNNGMVPTTLGMAIFKYEAMLESSQDMGCHAVLMMKNQWQNMLYSGATTFWETTAGHCDMNHAGSLCHGFSATPAYVFQAYVLGIQPIKPGFRSFRVRPVFGGLDSASGTVPTPHGDINVAWKKQGVRYLYTIDYPEGLCPEVSENDAPCDWSFVERKAMGRVQISGNETQNCSSMSCNL